MDERNEIKLTGVMSQGYGIIPKAVMRDPSLCAESKAIYCYLRSFAGAGNSAFPSRELICHEMNISKNRFNKYKNELIQKGFLTITRKRTENGFSRNIYEFNETVCPQSVDLQNEDIRIVDLQSVDLQNEDTNINSLNINSINNKSINSNSRNIGKPVAASNDLSKIFNFWEQNGFGMLAPKTRQDLEYWVNDFQEIGATENDAIAIVLRALEISVDNNARKYNYANSILKSWEQKRMLTAQQIEAEDKRPGKGDTKDTGPWEQDWGVPEQNKVELKMTEEEYRQFEDELPF